ncbi:hypothetical protein GOBAR_AA17783 [Gossypium barbadense]|uniref:Uncharacterized protein n=1 Tax=Gossypium barbadense TaxID=3634 RepID=A0A2P5XHQ4_GOSBA|nr:hypothetical protein GOBAR_AA17783 [Gossypium barbadense]
MRFDGLVWHGRPVSCKSNGGRSDADGGGTCVWWLFLHWWLWKRFSLSDPVPNLCPSMMAMAWASNAWAPIDSDVRGSHDGFGLGAANQRKDAAYGGCSFPLKVLGSFGHDQWCEFLPQDAAVTNVVDFRVSHNPFDGLANGSHGMAIGSHGMVRPFVVAQNFGPHDGLARPNGVGHFFGPHGVSQRLGSGANFVSPPGHGHGAEWWIECFGVNKA